MVFGRKAFIGLPNIHQWASWEALILASQGTDIHRSHALALEHLNIVHDDSHMMAPIDTNDRFHTNTTTVNIYRLSYHFGHETGECVADHSQLIR